MLEREVIIAMEVAYYTALFLMLSAIYFRLAATYRHAKDGTGEGMSGMSILIFALACGAFVCGVVNQWMMH